MTCREEAFGAGGKHFLAGALPPVFRREDLDFLRSTISGFFHCDTDGSEIDDAVAHHATVEQEIARGDQPVADVVSKNASTGSCPRDLRIKLRVPPNVVH